MNTETALVRAIEMAGGPANLARSIGIRTQAISQWQKAPANRCRAIEAATNGQVTRYQLRPDVFGDSPEPILRTAEAASHA